MMLLTREHADIVKMFEKEYGHLTHTKEDKSMWPKGYIYTNGHTNDLFLAYRKGYAFGKVTHAE